jgi:hypothetical protein
MMSLLIYIDSPSVKPTVKIKIIFLCGAYPTGTSTLNYYISFFSCSNLWKNPEKALFITYSLRSIISKDSS